MYTCTSCGYGSPSWYGKCPQCGEFNTFVKGEETSKTKKKGKAPTATFTPFSSIKPLSTKRLSTGIGEVDRVLGGGIVEGEVILLAGDPGVGKSTLLLMALSRLRTVYVSGEESAEQIRARAEGLGLSLDKLVYSSETMVESIIAAAQEHTDSFDVMVIDSIQTITSGDVDAVSGGISHIREVASKLTDFAKQSGMPIIIVGHVTKGGDIAGPKTLEHIVDAVLYLEGERVSQFRILRAKKNRFGTTQEVGVFSFSSKGLTPLTNPTALLEEAAGEKPGKAVVGTVEGSRVLFFEVQALAVPSVLSVPRRVVSGVDYNKVQLILAVLRKNLRLAVDSLDIYINVVGGVSIRSTAADLGIAAAVISSLKSKSVPKNSVFFGEVGLLGEVRPTLGQDRIARDAKRYGLTKLVSPVLIKRVEDLAQFF